VASRLNQAAAKRTADGEWAGQKPAKNEKGGWLAAADATRKYMSFEDTTLELFVKGQYSRPSVVEAGRNGTGKWFGCGFNQKYRYYSGI
jgi:hypothetical protein